MILAARPSQADEDEFQLGRGLEEQVNRPALGINGINMTPELAERMNLTNSQKGFLVEDIISGGPADLAGIRGGYKVANLNGSDVNLGGDTIVGIDETDVNTLQDIQSYLDTKKIGDVVQIQVIRDGQEITVPLKLGKLQSDQTPREQAPFEQLPQLPFSQEDPFGGDFFGDMYNQCIEGAGKEVCDQLFGR
jgi:hypothetical protein